MSPSWSRAHDWKSCKRESVSRVRISPSPPSFTDKKDIVPANGCTKLFVGINLAENRIALP